MRLLFLTYMLSFLALNVFAGQSNIDSLVNLLNSAKEDTGKVNLLNNLGRELINAGNFSSASKYIINAKSIAEKVDYKKGIANALTSEGLILSKKKQYKQALTLHEQALQIWITLRDDEGIRYSYYNIGTCYQWLNLYKESSSYFFKSMKLAEAAKDSLLLYKTLSSNAYLLQYMGNLNEPIVYQRKAIEYINISKYKGNYCDAIIFLASYYALNQQPEKADSVLKIAYTLARELKTPHYLSYYYNIKSELESERHNYGAAILSNMSSNKLEDSMAVSENIPYNNANIANYILKADKTQLDIAGIAYEKRFDEVIRYAQKSLDVTIPAGIINLSSYNYAHISTAYQGKGNFKQALLYYKMYKDIQDSLFNVKNSQTVQELKLKYETEKKEQQITVLNQDAELKASEMRRQAVIMKGSIGGLTIAGIFAFILFTSYNRKRKTTFEKQVAEVETKALRSQMNPHFIFNSLNSIDDYILNNDITNSSLYVNKFSRLMRLILESSRKDEVSIEEDLETLQLYIQLENLVMKRKVQCVIEVAPEINAEQTLIPPMLLQPFIENAFKHAFYEVENPKLEIKISFKDEMLHCTITDNGIGRDTVQELETESKDKSNSLGLVVTRERLSIISKIKKSKAYFVFEDLKDLHHKALGTKVVLTIPASYSF